MTRRNDTQEKVLSDIYDRLEPLEDYLQEVDFKNTYSNRKTRSRFTIAKPILASICVVGAVIMLLFMSDSLMSISTEDVALINTATNTSRDVVITTTEKAQEQIAEELNGASPSLEGIEYYDMKVPSTKTCGTIGGLLSGTGTDVYTGSTYTCPSYVKNALVGDLVSRETSPDYMTTLFSSTSKQYKLASVWEKKKEYSAEVPKCGVIDGRYMSAIQPYFYNGDKKYFEFNNCVGQCFDVVLTDGTVIPFIAIDANSYKHVNKDSTDRVDASWRNTQLLEKEYAYLFNSASGNMIELIGLDGCTTQFKDKFKLGTDIHIDYYRMYDFKVEME